MNHTTFGIQLHRLQLVRGGKPYFVEGDGPLDVLAKAGGNLLRTYDVRYE